jgi:hypothetical protein
MRKNFLFFNFWVLKQIMKKAEDDVRKQHQSAELLKFISTWMKNYEIRMRKKTYGRITKNVIMLF